MKRLLFLSLIMSVPIQANGLLEASDERIVYECVFCYEKISPAEVSLALLMATHGESPIFICDKCRKKRGKDDGQLKKEVIGHKPALGIISKQELDTGQRSVFRQSPSIQKILFEQYQKRKSIAVATTGGYRILAQKKSKFPLFFLKAPGEVGYRPCKFPTVSYVDEETGKEVTVGLPVDEMTPLVNGNVLVTAFGESDGGALFYRYDPRANRFHRLRQGELLQEMESCDQLIAQAEAKKVAAVAKEEKNKEILKKFFDGLLAKAEAKKVVEEPSKAPGASESD